MTTQPLNLSLFHLEERLAELVEYRQSLLADPENPANTDEIAALDAEIQRYEIAGPAKVTGVVGIFRRWKSQKETAKAEIKRLQQIVGHLECLEARLKDYCASVLERLPEPKKGCRKLTGADGSTLTLKGNGGLEPLEITDSSMIPDELCTYSLELTWNEWRSIKEAWAPIGVNFTAGRKPSNELIREALARPCPQCGGSGEIVGGFDGIINAPCTACAGSGKHSIPGARLLGRGSRVEAR